MPASTPYNRRGSALFDVQKGYAFTPTIGNTRSLSFPFHSCHLANAKKDEVQTQFYPRLDH